MPAPVPKITQRQALVTTLTLKGRVEYDAGELCSVGPRIGDTDLITIGDFNLIDRLRDLDGRYVLLIVEDVAH